MSIQAFFFRGSGIAFSGKDFIERRGKCIDDPLSRPAEQLRAFKAIERKKMQMSGKLDLAIWEQREEAWARLCLRARGGNQSRVIG